MTESRNARPGNRFVAIACVLGFLAVALGAFATHSLARQLDENALSIFRVGAQYQMYHALALLGLGLWCNSEKQRMPVAGWCWVSGVGLFSGSLYVLAVTGVRWLGAITPVGGILLMVGWVLFAFRAWNA